MIITVQDIIKMMEENINDDNIIVDNYSKVVSIIDKVNEEQAKAIFDNLIYNHEIAATWMKNFQAKSNLFTKQAKKSGIGPMDAAVLERLQKESEEVAEKRSNLEQEIGKAFLEKGFLSKETYEKYY